MFRKRGRYVKIVAMAKHCICLPLWDADAEFETVSLWVSKECRIGTESSKAKTFLRNFILTAISGIRKSATKSHSSKYFP